MLTAALVETYISFVLFAVVFGAFDGMYMTLFYIQMVTCVDPSQRPSAVGFAHFVDAAFVAGGPPLSGEEHSCIYLHAS